MALELIASTCQRDGRVKPILNPGEVVRRWLVVGVTSKIPHLPASLEGEDEWP